MPGFIINGEGFGPKATSETARVYRWTLQFDSIGPMIDVALYALSVQRPSPEFEVQYMHHKQAKINLPGKIKWNPINVKFYEVIDGVDTATAQAIWIYWSNVMEYTTNKLVVRNNSAGINFRTTCRIYTEDGLGSRYHKYTLYNVWPSKIDPAEFTYTDTAISTIGVTFQYDACEEEDVRGGEVQVR